MYRVRTSLQQKNYKDYVPCKDQPTTKQKKLKTIMYRVRTSLQQIENFIKTMYRVRTSLQQNEKMKKGYVPSRGGTLLADQHSSGAQLCNGNMRQFTIEL